MSLTEYVANFTLELRHEDIPESVRAKAIEHILDGYGLALSGQERPPVADGWPASGERQPGVEDL